MSKMDNICLVGPMGAGKSTVGRLLARELGRQFYDSDRQIELRTGVDIPLIFELEGEEGFREREQRTLEALCALQHIVLATGGGAVLRPANRRQLKASAYVVFLRAPLHQLVSRTARDRKRPLLQTGDPAATLAALMRERTPLYEEVADLIVDTGHRTVRTLVREICREYEQACKSSASS